MLKTYKWLFITLLAVYALVAFGLPPNPETLQRFNISTAQLRLLNATVVLPLIAIYFTALYGFLRFYKYAMQIRESKEGPHLISLAQGLMVLAFSLPVNSILGSLRSYVRFRYPEWLNEAVIFRNYVMLLFAIFAIYYIARGMEGLHSTLKKKLESSIPFYSFILPITLASVFTWLITFNGNTPASSETYFMPEGVLIATLIIPYTYVWSLGIRAVVQLYEYQRTVRGKIYRSILRDAALGIGLLMIISVLIQLLGTINSQLERLKLTPLLIIVYFLLVLYAIGYGLVARGAKKLTKIEEA